MRWQSDRNVLAEAYHLWRCLHASLSAQPPSPPAPPLSPPSSPSFWTVTSGAQYCHITGAQGSCVTDGAGSYGNRESCTVRADTTLWVSATEFDTENRYDRITIGGRAYSGRSGPSNVQMNAGSVLTWRSDGSVTRPGFVICASTAQVPFPPPPPSPPPPSPSPPPPAPLPPLPPRPPGGALWSIVSGSQFCHVENSGTCVTDGPGRHGNRENCVMRALVNLHATATLFQTEACCDWLTIGSTRYSGSGLSRGAAQRAHDGWQHDDRRSDYSITYSGFTICGVALSSPSLMPPAPPSPPAHPPAAPSYWTIVSGSQYCQVTTNTAGVPLCITDGRELR